GSIGRAGRDRAIRNDGLDEGLEHQPVAVRTLDWNIGPAAVSEEPQRLVAERIGQVEPAERAVDLDGFRALGAGRMRAGDEVRHAAVRQTYGGARRILDVDAGRRSKGSDVAADRNIVEPGDVADGIELVDRVHHHHTTAGHGFAGPPVEMARRAPIVAALVDDGAEAHDAHLADAAFPNDPARDFD